MLPPLHSGTRSRQVGKERANALWNRNIVGQSGVVRMFRGTSLQAPITWCLCFKPKPKPKTNTTNMLPPLHSGTRSRQGYSTTVTNAMALVFEVLGRFNRARAARLTLPHHVCQTPLFMPVGTQGTIKGLTNSQLEDIGCQIILGNTYHLALRPTSELLDEVGGLHNFMNWQRGLLTDSGGFQMVSLLHLADITEKGVTFQSPVDGKPMLLTPEESIQIQNRIGADIIMALDDVVKTTITGPRVEEAMYRTLRWIDRCIAAHKRPHDQNLFGIVQGGLDPILRDICAKGLVDRNLPGYAIGGLSGGEDKNSFWRVVAQCTAALPEDKPRYVMGVGYPLDIVVCSALGADMYDCVYPTRTARFGTALIPEGVLKLKHKAMAEDTRPIDPTCPCMVCKNYTRAYIHCLVTKDAMGSQLLSYHNLYYMLQLSRNLHSSIVEGRFPEFVCDFLHKMVCSRKSPGP
ncbi:queuine tRNA-ribosyltransferase [Vigna unguiculata]|uniref:Queuine tRNA-ribosyltransferase catalytic subunit 1 n=1 Tax=Vigna unguiculata TaxID=3917 RepID=A0A4D6LXG2_VIGUN|nr:queuine tRNA-ribosyltransferase [Vigna unguiculata]